MMENNNNQLEFLSSLETNQSSSLANHFKEHGFQRSGKNNPCPICQRTKDSDCGWNTEVVFCHTYVAVDAKVSGYVYRGKRDIWGQYFVESQSVKTIRPKAKSEYIYEDSNAAPLVRVTRQDQGNGKKSFFQSRWNGDTWQTGLIPEIKSRLHLYKIFHPMNQEAIAKQDVIFLVEGEGKVDLLLDMGIAATCSIGGAGKWRKYGYPNYLDDLQGANLVLCPDRDQPGVKHCLDIKKDFPQAQWLKVFPDSAEWNDLPEKNGLDIVDWVELKKVTFSEILAAISPLKESSELLEIPTDIEEKEKKKEVQTKVSELLLGIAEQGDYFHTSDQKVFVDLEINDVRQTLDVRGKLFRLWLQRELFQQHQKTVGTETLNQVLGVLEAKANFDERQQEVHLRIAEHNDKIYLDLGSDDWTAVEVGSEGWQIVSDYPVRFRRHRNLMSLPHPQKGGNINELRSLLKLSDEGWILILMWLLFCFYPHHPHPILILHGEQGTGKSFLARLLKSLVDPGKAPLIPNIADLRNLAIAANNRWVMVYDNLSRLSASQSDALCRISTGGGFSTRTLYANNEETVFEFIRPQIITGIDSLASRGDLLERALLVELPVIPETERMTEAELETKFKQLGGKILGSLLTAFSQTLKSLEVTEPPKLSRMADFAKFAIAAEVALELPAGEFLQAYNQTRQEAHETALDSSLVACALVRLMESYQGKTWKGSPTELLKGLENFVDEQTIKRKVWTGNVRALGKELKRLAPDLRGFGIQVDSGRTNKGRYYEITKSVTEMSHTS